MNKEIYLKIKSDLSSYSDIKVNKYLKYLKSLWNDTDSKGKKKNQSWMKKINPSAFAQYYKEVNDLGIELDGKHVTLNYNGVTFDYIAYKNLLLQKYPEAEFVVELVYEDDKTDFKIDSGKIVWNHEVVNPFDRSDEKIIGGYCVIKISRGEFLTTLTKQDLEKHRKVAKTDYIWQKWYAEMCKKTLIRKAVKFHFEDDFENVNEIDNDQYDLAEPVQNITDTQLDILKNKLSDDMSEKQMCTKLSVDNLSDIPADLFDKALAIANSMDTDASN